MPRRRRSNLSRDTVAARAKKRSRRMASERLAQQASGQTQLHASAAANQSKIMSLILDCEEDELSDAQKKLYTDFEAEQNEFTKRIDEIVTSKNAGIIKIGRITVYQLGALISSSSAAGLVDQQILSQILPQTIPHIASQAIPQVITQAAPQAISQPVPQAISQALPQTTITSSSSNCGLIKPKPTSNLLNSSMISAQNVTNVRNSSSAPAVVLSKNNNLSLQNQIGTLANIVITVPGTVSANTITVTKQSATTRSSFTQLRSSQQNESTSITKALLCSQLTITPSTNVVSTASYLKERQPVVDLTEDEAHDPDSCELPFARFPGKTYPSLMVVARPYLKSKFLSSSEVQRERSNLDAKVKSILTKTPTTFTEWLIQNGLVCAELVCNIHMNTDMTPVKMKLGMYTDSSRFPYSGGYVRISECCPQKFVSVFNGSIFEDAPHPPTILLKLIYHWACQTTINNILSWVKNVDNLYVRNFFTYLRAVCTAVVNDRMGKLGGPRQRVEVGIISLGTTSVDGYVKQVKVEVLGVMDLKTRNVRLRAVDPPKVTDRNRTRFYKIFEHLEKWVHKDSIILTDSTVDKSVLTDLGYKTIYLGNKDNQTIMDYLKNIVPRMFQNTLSLLNTRIIQQFLDELCWRECWGAIPSSAFNNIISHISEQSKLVTGYPLIQVLSEISRDPFKDWRYDKWKANCSESMPELRKEVVTLNSNMEKSTSTNQIVNQTINQIVTQPVNQMVTQTNSQTITTATSQTSSPIVNQIINQAATQTTDSAPVSPASNSNSVPISSASSTTMEEPNFVDDSATLSKKNRKSDTSCKYSEDKMNMNINSNINPMYQNLSSLESYYYGSLPPDNIVISKLKKIDLNMKCYACKSTFNNNILFMKHLIGHALNEGAFTVDNQCQYCLRNFITVEQLEEHIANVHSSSQIGLTCLICEERFTRRVTLITHMHMAHVKLELPYQCTICKYRSSEHKKVVDHFYEMHNGGERVQCPLCLKVVSFENNNRKLTANVSFFISHIQRHMKKTMNWKCNRCILTFVKKSYLKEHQSKDHTSCSVPGIIRYPPSITNIQMPVPPIVTAQQKKAKSFTTSPVGLYTVCRYEHTIRPVRPKSFCFECLNPINDTQHFGLYYQCMQCVYATCCKESIMNHIDVLHGSNSSINASKMHSMSQPLYCQCGFSSYHPDECARHLENCSRKTLFDSAEKASNYTVQTQSANFPTLVTLDDQSSEDEGNQSTSSKDSNKTEEQSMLSVLGLRRKIPADNLEKDAEDSDSDITPPPTKKVDNKRTANECDPLAENDDVFENGQVRSAAH